VELRENIAHFFEEQLSDLNCQYDTKAYIVGIFRRYQTAEFDLSKESITVYFSEARHHQDFSKYQACGDWLFFCRVLMPEHLRHADRNYYDTVARLSYYSCYRLLNRQWKSFEELADQFVPLENEVSSKLRKVICL
jgi:hypothetical protein